MTISMCMLVDIEKNPHTTAGDVVQFCTVDNNIAICISFTLFCTALIASVAFLEHLGYAVILLGLMFIVVFYVLLLCS